MIETGTATLAAKVQDVVARELRERFADRFTFGPIQVAERLNLEDDPYLQVNIVFDGGTSREHLRALAKGALGLMTSVHGRLAEQGEPVDMLLLPSYISKSEWDEYGSEATA